MVFFWSETSHHKVWGTCSHEGTQDDVKWGFLQRWTRVNVLLRTLHLCFHLHSLRQCSIIIEISSEAAEYRPVLKYSRTDAGLFRLIMKWPWCWSLRYIFLRNKHKVVSVLLSVGESVWSKHCFFKYFPTHSWSFLLITGQHVQYQHISSK